MNLQELGKKFLAAGAPTLGLALGGPLGAVAAGVIAKRLGADSDSADDIDKALKAIPGGMDMTVLEGSLKDEIESERLKMTRDVNLAQIDLNKAEVKSGSKFIGGWRPALGWVGVNGLGYHFILRPILNGLVVLFCGPEVERDIAGVIELHRVLGTGPAEVFPDIDAPGLIALVTVMLGGVGVRAFEAVKGVKRKFL